MTPQEQQIGQANLYPHSATFFKRPRYFLGYRDGGGFEVFKSEYTPTQESDGLYYLFCVGPFQTKRGAEFMRRYGHNNPHCQTVSQAERLAKLDQEGKLDSFGQRWGLNAKLVPQA